MLLNTQSHFKHIDIFLECLSSDVLIYGPFGLHFQRDHPGDISPSVMSLTFPSPFSVFLLNQTHIQNILQTFVPSLSEIVFSFFSFFGGGGGEHVDQDEWAWLVLSAPQVCGDLS